MKILNFSDLHAQPSTIEEVKKCGSFIVDQARREDPDLIIFSGDAFEKSGISLDSEAVKFVFWMFQSLADVAPVHAVIGTISHDGKAIEVFKLIEAAFPIHVTSEGPEQLFLIDGEFHTADHLARLSKSATGADAIISAIPAPQKTWFKSMASIEETDKAIAQGLSEICAGFGAVASQYDCVHLLNTHCDTNVSEIAKSQTIGTGIKMSRDQMERGNFDLMCIGHIHMAQELWPGAFHPGSTQPNTWGELDPKGFYVHHLLKHGEERLPQESFFIKTPTQPMIDLAMDFTTADPIEMAESITSLPRAEYEGAKVRLRVKFFVDEKASVNEAAIRLFFKDANADLKYEPIPVPRQNVRSKRIQDLDGLYDQLKETADILEEPIPEGVKEICVSLEGDTPEEILKGVAEI